MSESLAIIGISCLFPKADDLQEYWRNIKNGVDAITPIPASHWNVADYFDADPKAPDRTYAQRGGFLSPVTFNPMDFGMAPKDVEATDTTQLLGMFAAKQALIDAGYGEKPFKKERTSVILGVTGALELVIPLGARLGHPLWRRALKEAGVSDSVASDVVQRISDGYVGWQENSFPGLLGNVAAGRIANRLDLGGTNCVVDAACASSMAALHLAAMELMTGRSDMVITGGLDTFNDIFMYMCFSKTPALSPSGDAKPFDRSCDGTILGEGLGMLVLKRLKDAERDGDRIHAVIKGMGSSSDGRGNAIYAPRAEGQKQAVRRAYAAAGVTADTIELVEAHGTGTKVGDATELQGLMEVFRGAGNEGSWAALGSVKSQIGHTKAAAGVAGLIKAALALEHKVLPPTIKVSQPVDELAPGRSPFYVNTQKRPWLPRETHPRRAGVSAFGFGGTNFHCVLEEHDSQRNKPGWDGDVEILAFSSDHAKDLRNQVSGLPVDGTWTETRRRAQQSREQFRRDAKYRLLIPAAKGTPLAPLRDAAVTMLDKHPEKASWVLPNGVAFGSGERRGKLGALFPGQGSQYVGMFRDLACQFPAMIEALTAADRVFASVRPECGQQRLSDFIYPHPGFSDDARLQQEEALKSTDIAQPALGAAGLGAMNVLAYFGITPEAAAGHSYGELLALCGAGRFETESLHLLSNVRGRLMACGKGGDRGAMLAAQASEEVVNRFVEEENLQLVVANRNSPSQFVLAGPTSQIEQAAGELAKRSVRARVLKVSAAFHSSLVADAKEPFAAALENVAFSRGRIPVYANSTAKAYPNGAKQARELLANQIVKPVDFMAQIETMYADGVTTFVEMGPGHVLSDLVQAILHGREVEAVALDASKGSRSGTFDLAVTLCRLAALGHAVELSRWEVSQDTRQAATNGKPNLTMQLSGANHRSPRPQRPPTVLPANTIAGNGHASNGHSVPVPSVKAPASVSAPVPARIAPVSAGTGLQPSVSAALQVAQQGMLTLQKLQEETARLHRQFLENQDAARRTLESLLSQRRELLGVSNGQQTPSALPQSGIRVPAEIQSTPQAIQFTSPAPAVSPAPSATTQVTREPAPVVSSKRSSAAVSAAVLDVVAEKTGYPAEMLNLDMGLDSDLGIDSIKRVEIMAALRGRLPASPEIKPEHLGTLQTLRQVTEFLSAGQGNGIVTTEKAKEVFSVDVSRASEVLLNVVAEKTGYPVEMLNLEMGLDSDLGVDSIKRVEIMASIRAQLPEAPEIKPEHLGALQTLQQVVDFLTSGHGTKAAAAPAREANSTVDNARASEVLLNVVAEKTGYPVEMLNLGMGLDSDLGVDSIKRVEIMASIRTQLPEAPEIKPEHLGSLQTLQQVVDFLTQVRESTAPANPVTVHTAERAPEKQSNSSLNASAVARAVLDVVAEKTGYPVDMLNLDMGLDVDLGIDSIKRVEIMASLRSLLPSAPEIKPEHLGAMQTLKQVVDFLTAGEKPAGVASSSAPEKSGGAGLETSTATLETKASPVALHRQIIKPVRLDKSDTRAALTLPPKALIWVTEDGSDLAAAVEERLKERGYCVCRGTPAELISSGARPCGLLVLWPKAHGDDSVLKENFKLIQAAGPSLKKTGGLLVTASRLDGNFGFGSLNGNCNPVSGGLAGILKTAHHEWPEVHCKAIDLNPEEILGDKVADSIVDEMFFAGPIEVGIAGNKRFGLQAETISLPGDCGKGVLTSEDVVVVSGGARGITATTALHLARKHGLRLVLLGRSQLTETEPEWLAGLRSESEIKKALMARANGNRSPRKIEAGYREAMAQREIRECLRQVRAAGATAHYRAVDVRNAAEVRQVFEDIRKELGPVRGLIHGAGVLADRKIEDKTEEQFDLVYSTKVSGLRNLLSAAASDDLKVLALFSSYTGRFGRTGQVDYAAANEVLNKIAQSESRRRPDCRVVSFNWGPWNGGMVSDGLRKIFEKEGVGLIDPQAGAELFVREISSQAQSAVEVLVLATASAPGGPASQSAEEPGFCVAFERELSVKGFPCLESHVLNGRAVLPTALMIEWLAHGAVHDNPGLSFHGFENFKVLKGLILEKNGSVVVSVLAGAARLKDGLLCVPVQMISRSGERRVLHARAEVMLAETLPSAPVNGAVPTLGTHANGRQGTPSVYGNGNLFHGPHFHGIEWVETCSESGITGLVKSAPSPKQWIHQPLRPGWLADPLALDSSFQMMILWSWEHRDAASLPCAIRRFRQFATTFPKSGSRVVIRIDSAETALVTASLHFYDQQGTLLALAEGYECVIDSGLRDAFRQNRL